MPNDFRINSKDCYKCTSKQKIEVRNGKQVTVECRQYTRYGLAMIAFQSAQLTELFDKKLIDIVDIGVDSAEFEAQKVFRSVARSRGAGGLNKHECGVDYQPLELIHFRKLGHTERIYDHHKVCPKEYIGTVLQDMIFENGRYSDANNPDNALSDMIQEASQRAISEAGNLNDIIGIFGSADKYSNAYNGILAQAYWAYTRNAHFQSLVYVVNETVFVDGTYLNARYSGVTYSVKLDVSQPSDPDQGHYQTTAEAYNAIAVWLNDQVLGVGNKKLVDATFVGNEIFVTSRWTEATIDLKLTVSEDSAVNWETCTVLNGVTIDIVENAMSIDERPYLVNYQAYTMNNVLTQLPMDIFAAVKDMETDLMLPGQSWGLYIDEKLYNMYKQALLIGTMNQPMKTLEEVFGGEIFTLKALSRNGGTGLWFITAISDNPALRNVKHLIDSMAAQMPYIGLTPNCREMEILFDTLHGVLVRDFRLFAANLLCSPMAAILDQKDPDEQTQKLLPCYDRRVRENMQNPTGTTGCTVQAGFVQKAFFKDNTKYALPNIEPGTGYTVYQLQAGDTRPLDALDVWTLQLQDTTTGIPIEQLPGTTYEYRLITNDGVEVVSTAQNPIFSFFGGVDGVVFNVIQTVNTGACEDVYNYSQRSGNNFELLNPCDDVNLELAGTIRLSDFYVVTSVELDTEVETSEGNIDLSGNSSATDVEGAAEIINQWFLDNGFEGTATAQGGTLVIYSPEVEFIAIDPDTANDLFVRTPALSIVDNTTYAENNPVDSYAVKVWCVGDPEPVNATFNALPSAELVDSCDSWNVSVTVTSEFGCIWTVTAVVDSADILDGVVSFNLLP
jgi:hypothetical protein